MNVGDEGVLVDVDDELELHGQAIIVDPYTGAKKSVIFLYRAEGMALYAEHVVRRFVAGKLLARSVPDLVALAERDAAGVKVWKQGFYSKHLTAIRKTYADVVRKLLADKRWADSESTQYTLSSMKKVYDEALRTLEDFRYDLNERTFDEVRSLYGQVEDEFWDPEMFADGQTKADYARKDVDDFLDVVAAMLKPLYEFWRRFEEKWTNNLSITLLGLVDESQDTKHLYLDFLKNVEVDVERALHTLAATLRGLPEQSGSGRASIGASLAALGAEAKRAGDTWTLDFIRTLTDMTTRHRSMSPKQKAIFEQKLDQYDVPRPNYDKFW